MMTHDLRVAANAKAAARPRLPRRAGSRNSPTCSPTSGSCMSLLAVWGVMTLIGVVVDQGKDPSVYFTSYPAALARLVLRLHLDTIYHSTAYVGMIGLILAAMTFATFKRVIPMRMPPLRPVKIEMIPLHASVAVAGEEAGVRERIAQFFASRGWPDQDARVRRRGVDVRRQARLGRAAAC